MTDQTPEPVDSGEFEIDETRVEGQKTTNLLDDQDDVEIAEDQSTTPDPGQYDEDAHYEAPDGAE